MFLRRGSIYLQNFELLVERPNVRPMLDGLKEIPLKQPIPHSARSGIGKDLIRAGVTQLTVEKDADVLISPLSFVPNREPPRTPHQVVDVAVPWVGI
jgi:hypothetical protein